MCIDPLSGNYPSGNLKQIILIARCMDKMIKDDYALNISKIGKVKNGLSINKEEGDNSFHLYYLFT